MNSATIKKIKQDPVGYANHLSVRKLVKLLKELDTAYHTDSKPVISDRQYDKMVDVLEERSPNNKYLSTTGAPVKNSRTKVRLPHFMPSLGKAKPLSKALVKWLGYNQGPFVVADKLDGISICIVYDKGIPVQAYTRGDGKIGQDISHHLPALKIPKKINVRKAFAIRAEVIMTGKSFTSNGGDYDNARNMTGGVLNTLEPSNLVNAFRVYVYEILDGTGSTAKLSAQLTKAKSMGFTVVPFKKVAKLDDPSLVRILTVRKKKALTAIDGIVLTQDRPYKRVRAGLPEYSIAFKMNMEDAMVETTVTSIEWNISKHNKLVPTILVKPVRVGDITVKRASGHNAYFILHGHRSKDKKLHVGEKPRPINIGTRVLLVRSGDVIPHIEKVIRASRKPLLPQVDYKVSSSGVDFYLDDNADDSQGATKRLTNFFSALDIEGIREGVIRKLEQEGYDLYDIIHADVDDFLHVPGVKEKSAQKMVISIKKGLATATFVRMAKASGLFGEGIGERRLQEVYTVIPNIMSIRDIDKLTEQITSIDSFRVTTATKIATAIPKFRKFLRDNDLRIVKEQKIVSKGVILNNQRIVFTRVRDKELSKWITENGGTVQTSMRKDTTMLITKDNIGASAKETKAHNNGIHVITLADFYNKYNVKI